MHELGISVYPEKENLEETYHYMALAAHYGYTRIFTCLLSVDESKEKIMKDFKAFMDKAHELGFKVAVDTNQRVFKHLGANYDDLSPFKEMGVDIIRLDESFGFDGDVTITHNPEHIMIEFNASMNPGVDVLIKGGANVNQMTVCHNFFPERYSGLDWQFFNQMNAFWKSLNLHTAAFVSSQEKETHGPWNVFCGLPTCEDMRSLPIDLQGRYYFATGLVDDVIIGNAFASEEELKALASIARDQVTLKMDEEKTITDIEKAIVYDYNPHWTRFDASSYFLRSSMVRLLYKDQSIPYVPYEKDHFSKGDVLIVNDNLAHYRGELEIALRDIPNDGERNCVGHIKEEELGLLDYIHPGYHFKILKEQ